MAPKKAGKKKDEVVDLPKASTLPSGQLEYFIGGWSSRSTLSNISEIAELVRPRKEEDEATTPSTQIFVLAGSNGSAGTTESVLLSHKMHVVGLVPKAATAAAAAFDSARRTASGAGGADGEGGDGGAAPVGDEAPNGDEEQAAAAATAAANARKVIVPDLSVRVASDVTLAGVRPTVTVQPVVVEVKAAAPSKGKKVSEEEKQREADERKAREEAALQAAKEEEDRLNKFAMPLRWASVVVENITFEGRVAIAQAHITFKNCVFSNASVEVSQHCKVVFEGCLFAQPLSSALYCFPLADVVVRGCVFTGLPPPTSPDDAETAFASASIPADRQNSVGIHTDGAKLLVDSCSFEWIGTGVLLRGKYDTSELAVPPSEEATPQVGEGGAKKKKPIATAQVVQQSSFDCILITAILCDNASGIALKKNKVLRAAYYGLRVVGGGKAQLVHGNTFASNVSIGKGCFPTLHTNVLELPLDDANNTGNVFMEPTY